MDAIEDVGEVGLRVEAVQLCRLDDRHGAGERLGAGVGAREEPVFSSDADRAQGALGRIVVDADAAVLEEQAEGRPAAEAVAEGLGQVALAR